MSDIDLTEAQRAGAAYLVAQGLNRSGPDMSARIVDLAAPLIEAAVREQIVASVRDAEYEYLPSPGLDPAWISGWRAAVRHAAIKAARNGATS